MNPVDLRFHYILATSGICLSTALLAFYVYFNGPRKRVNRFYVLWSLSISLWSFSLLLNIFAQTQGAAVLMCRLLHVWAALIPVTFLRFVLALTDKFPQRRFIFRIFIGVVFFILGIIWTPWFLTAQWKPAFGFFVTEPRLLYPIHPILFVLCITYASFELWGSYRKAVGVRRKQLQYFLIGTLIGYSGGTTNYLINYGLQPFPFYPFGSYTILPYVAMVGIAIARYKLMDIEVLIKRSLVFAGLSVFILGTMTFATMAAQEWLSQFLPTERWVLTLGAAFLVVLLYDPFKAFLVNITDRFLFQRRYDYKELLRKFTNEALAVLDLRKLVDMTVHTVAETMRLESCRLLLLSQPTNRYELTASVGIGEHPLVLDEAHPLIKLIKGTQVPLVRDSVDENQPGLEAIEEALEKLTAEVCLPLALHNELVGILTLGRKKSDEPYTKDDMEVLTTLANTEAIAISNALLAAEVAQKEKLAVIGTLAAAINHEVCGPLHNVKTRATGFLMERKEGWLKPLSKEELEENMAEFMQFAVGEIDKTAAITTRLSNFAKPGSETKPESVDVKKVVEEVDAILRHDLELRGITVEEVFPKEVPPIFADRRQLHEILFNLVRNAGQAIEQSGRVTVQVKLNGANRVAVDVTDTGCGIPPQQLRHLFIPFFTTKKEGQGTGLGLFIVKQLVERNGGTIGVQSQVGVGTTFTVEFPVIHP